MNLKITLFLILSFHFFEVYSATPSNLKVIKDRISHQGIEVNKLAAEIKDIEKKIASNNSKYVKKMKTLDNLEKEIQRLKESLRLDTEEISKEYKLTKLSFDNYLLESSDEESENTELNKEIFLELLSKKLKDLKTVQKFSQTNLVQVNKLEQEASRMKQDEEDLYHIIISLENNKKKYSQKYIDTLEMKNSDQVELDKILIRNIVKKKVAKSNVPFKLSLPIDNYLKINKTKDGLNFKYSETTAILAPRAGKVVYAGDLASYGNVVIIDHGNQVRSVLLGDIATKVKKGDLLTNKQLIGYTVADLGTTKSLYFEVRKKDNAENALNWLDTENLKI